MMREETTTTELRDGTGRFGWERHLDQALAARLGRRATVIPSALGDRIWRRIQYFTTRTQSLAQSLVDRVAPVERVMDEVPVVHVGWQSPSPVLDSSPYPVPTSDTTLSVAVQVVQVESVEIQTVRHSTVEPEVSPARVPRPVVTASLYPVERPAAGHASGEGARFGDGDDHNARPLGARPAVAPQALREPGPTDTSLEDAATTLKMPPARRPARPAPPPLPSAPIVDLDRPHAHEAGKSNSFPRPRDEAVQILEMPALHPAITATAPSRQRVLPAIGKAEADAARPLLDVERAAGSPDGNPGKSSMAPNTIHPEFPRASKTSSHVDFPYARREGDREEGHSRLPGETRTGQVPDEAGRSAHSITAVEMRDRVEVAPMAPRQQSVLVDRSRRASAAVVPPLLPHTDHARPAPSNPAASIESLQTAGDIAVRSSEPGDSTAPGSVHVPTLSTNTEARPADTLPLHALRELIDVNQLTRKVERRIMKRLAIDAERRGGWS